MPTYLIDPFHNIYGSCDTQFDSESLNGKLKFLCSHFLTVKSGTKDGSQKWFWVQVLFWVIFLTLSVFVC